MIATADLAVWSKEEKALWVEPYLITLFPTIMALTADKLRPVQIKAEAAGKALVRAHLFFEGSNRAAPAPFYSAAAGHGPQSRAGCTRRRPLRSLCRLARGWTDGGHRPAKTQRTQGSGAFFAERLHTRACGAGGRRVACALAGRRISHAPPISPLPLRAALLFAHTPPARFSRQPRTDGDPLPVRCRRYAPAALQAVRGAPLADEARCGQDVHRPRRLVDQVRNPPPPPGPPRTPNARKRELALKPPRASTPDAPFPLFSACLFFVQGCRPAAAEHRH